MRLVSIMSHSALLYATAGFAISFLVGMTGIGGGSLMTPLLILLFGVNPATAVGTDLLYVSITKSAGTIVHGFGKTIDWRVVRRLSSGSIPAAAITLVALSYLDINSSSAQKMITGLLAVALFLTALALVWRSKL